MLLPSRGMLRFGQTRVVDPLVGRLPPGLHTWLIVRTSKRLASNTVLMPVSKDFQQGRWGVSLCMPNVASLTWSSRNGTLPIGSLPLRGGEYSFSFGDICTHIVIPESLFVKDSSHGGVHSVECTTGVPLKTMP